MKRYVQVGCGNRGLVSYAVPLVKEYSDCAELCGVYDTNPKRALLTSRLCEKSIPVFDDFDRMLKEVKPDVVIVATKDSEHDSYCIRAMRAGCDVICEKPLTTTFEKALEIQKVKEETGRDLTVTFNLRFQPVYARIKELIREGVIGEVLNVHFEWMLNTRHGADYFRRWHRQRKNSGSLLVHKSTHHFDLVNWFLEQEPLAVNAFGTRRFYGPTRDKRSERCLTCPYKGECEFYYQMDDTSKELYLDCEEEDGYIRDACVFSEEIDIEDSMSVNVLYSGGAIMSYSLTAHSPYEGFNMTLGGTLGRMEISVRSSGFIGYREDSARSVKIYNRKGEEIQMKFPKDQLKGHGGADPRLRDMLFRGKTEDPLGQMASLRAGMMSIGIGMAANLSMAEKRQVELKEFYKELR